MVVICYLFQYYIRNEYTDCHTFYNLFYIKIQEKKLKLNRI